MKTPRLEINEPRFEVRMDGKEISLAPKEYDILLLLKTTNVVITRQKLLDTIWKKGNSFDFDSRTVDQHVCRIRAKLWPSIIKTVPNRGYKFSA